MKSAVVTGCFGLICSRFTDKLLNEGWYVYGIDKETYASNDNFKKYFEMNERFTHIKEDIAELKYLPDCDVVVHFAAESHVDNSINDSDAFVTTNVFGTKRLLDLVKAKNQYKMPLFVMISTDEIYGDNLTDTPHTTSDILNPSNPYSASKASAEMFVLAYHRTYGVPYLMFRPTNNYGTGQHPEKLIPKAVQLLMRDEKITLHGDGSFQRCWLHAEDTANAVYLGIMTEKCRNKVYNLSGDEYLSIREVAEKIIRSFGYYDDSVKLDPEFIESKIEYSFYRKGADVVYKIDDSDFRSDTGWKPEKKFATEIKGIVEHISEPPIMYRW